MSKLIGALRVDLDLRSAKFKRGMSDAQKRLASLGRQFKLAAAGTTVLASALAGVALKAGAVIDSQAKIGRVLGTTTASMQVLARAGELAGVSMGEIEAGATRLTRRLSLAAQGVGPAAGAFDRLGLSITDLQALPLDERISTITTAIRDMIPASEQAAEMSKIFGDRGFAAFQKLQPEVIRQAVAEIDRFGVAVSDVDAARIETANDQISQLGLLARGIGNDLAVALVPRIGAMAAAFASAFEVGKPLRQFFTGLIDQIPRLSTYALTFTGVMGVRYVTALVAARVATFTMVGSLKALRGALISSGIGALVVASGELIYRFAGLAEATGGIGNAMRLLRDVAGEVLERVNSRVVALDHRFQTFEQGVKAGMADAMAGALDAVARFANGATGLFLGVFEAVKAVWSSLPDVFRVIGGQAVNALLDVLQSGLNGIPKFINGLLEGVGLEPKVPTLDLSQWRQEVGTIGDVASGAAAKISGAFSAARATNYTGDLSSGLREVAQEARAAAQWSEFMGDVAARNAGAPLKSVQALRDAVADAGEAAKDAAQQIGADGAAGAADDLAKAAAGSGGGGAAGAVKKVKDALDPAREAAKKFAETMKGAVTGAVDGVANAWGDFVARGFRDFKGFVSAVKSSFLRMISQMVAAAAKNRIMISLGLSPSGGGVAGAVQQAFGGGGGLSGIAGKVLGSLGGGSGILGGLSSVVGGLFKGGIGGAVSGLSTALGGGLTSAIGGLLPVVGLAAAAFSFFRTKTKELDRGLRLTATGTDLLVESFRKVEKSRFWGLSKKRRTYFDSASEELQQTMAKAFGGLRDGVLDAARQVGVGSGAIDGFRAQIKLSTKGMDKEQAQKAVLAELTKLSDQMAQRIIDAGTGSRKIADAMVREGEGAAAALQAMAGSLSTINSAFEGLGLRALEGSLVSANAARGILDQVGGAQAFQQAADHYFGAFYSVSEQAKLIGKRLRGQIRDLGVGGAISNGAELRQMVERLNAQGRNAAAAGLIALSPLFSQWQKLTEQVAATSQSELDAARAAQKQRADAIARERQGLLRQLYQIQGRTVDLRRMELAALLPANRALQQLVWRTRDMEDATKSAVAILNTPLKLDSDRYATRYAATMAAARERDAELEKVASGQAQLTELKLIRTAIKRIEDEQRDRNLRTGAA